MDTYVFAAGFGNDVVTDPTTATDTNVNALVFEAGLAREDVYFDAGNLTFRQAGGSVALAVPSGYPNRYDGTQVQENFYGTAQFSDGTRFETAELGEAGRQLLACPDRPCRRTRGRRGQRHARRWRGDRCPRWPGR